MAILDDPVWQQSFRDWWEDGRTGFTVARLKRLLKLEKDQLTRDLSEMFVDRCPLPSWNGVRLSEPYARWRTFVHTGRGTRDDAELAFFETLPRDRSDEASFLIALLRAWDIDLCWWSITANATEAITEKVLLDEAFLPGFSDSGAHITNMAFYDVNLRALKTAARHGPEVVARMVHRLTRLPASVFGVDAGRLEPGAQADLVLIDPDALAAYDGEANTLRIHRDAFEHEQLVNRSDGVVPAVWIRGRLVWDGAAPTPILGTEPLGRCLRVEAG